MINRQIVLNRIIAAKNRAENESPSLFEGRFGLRPYVEQPFEAEMQCKEDVIR